MRIKDFLNEFEADRAALPGVEKETLAKLRNKTIVITGGELARCLCYAFLYNNEAKRLGIKVILLGKSRNAMASYHSELLLRDDFDFVDYNSASEICYNALDSTAVFSLAIIPFIEYQRSCEQSHSHMNFSSDC
jgi:hypothetical protein